MISRIGNGDKLPIEEFNAELAFQRVGDDERYLITTADQQQALLQRSPGKTLSVTWATDLAGTQAVRNCLATSPNGVGAVIREDGKTRPIRLSGDRAVKHLAKNNDWWWVKLEKPGFTDSVIYSVGTRNERDVSVVVPDPARVCFDLESILAATARPTLSVMSGYICEQVLPLLQVD